MSTATTCRTAGCARPVAEQGARHCWTHDISASREVLVIQLEKRQRDLAEAEAEVVSWRAVARNLIGRDEPISARDMDILTRVAAALLLRREAQVALQSSSHESTGRPATRSKRYAHPAPGASTVQARRHGNRLVRDLAQACETFETAAEHMWDPPRPEDLRPRCRIRSCDGRDRRQLLDSIRCGWCGTPFSDQASDRNDL